MRRQFKTRKWVTALVLALGVGTVWGVVVGVGGAIVKVFLPSSPITTENLVVASDGTPLIQARLANNYNHTELRTLDGQTIELEKESWLGSASFSKPYREPGVLPMPISWGERIAGCSDYSKLSTSWILLRDDRRPGSAYFTGYDVEDSNLGVGFIGRRGMRSSIPPADEQFDLGNQTLYWGSELVTSAGQIRYGTMTYQYGAAKPEDGRLLAPWIVFLLDGNVIQEIDLRSHTVRQLEKIEGLLGIRVAEQPVSVVGEQDKEAEKQGDVDQQTNHTQSKFRLAAMQAVIEFPIGAVTQINTKQKTAHRLIARCTDRIVAINPFDGSQQEFSLPENLHQEAFAAYMVPNDQLLLQVGGGYWEHGGITNLLWINSTGEVTRQETLRLAGYTPGNEKLQLLAVTAIVPTLLPWVIGTTIIGPFTMVQDHQVENYLAGLSEGAAEIWPALLLILVLSVVLTLVVRRWQKKYCRDDTVLWCVTVFATTVPGLLAYWLMHRGTAIEDCAECGQPAPRDRDACAHCEKPFAAPAKLGTEILT